MGSRWDSIYFQVLSRYETQRPANTPLSAPRFLSLCQHNLLITLKTIWPIKSRKRNIRKKKYLRPGTIRNRKLIIHWIVSEITDFRLNDVHNSKLNVRIIDSNFHSDDSNFTKMHPLQYVSVSSKVLGCPGLDLEKVCCIFFLGRVDTANSPDPPVRAWAWERIHSVGLFFLFCCDTATQLALQLHQQRTQVYTVSVIGTWFPHELR